MVQTAFELTQEQTDTLHAWYENALQAGSMPFAANVAKIGAGTEWWKAYIVGGYSADYQAGGLYLVTLTLRLCGLPSDTGPVLTSMATELTINLVASTGPDSDQSLASELDLALETSVDLGPRLFTEAFVHLYNTLAGGPANPSLESEVFCHLQTLSIVVPGELFASEAVVQLLGVALADTGIGSEASIGLLGSIATGSNYVATPAALSVYAYMGYSPGGQAAASVRYGNDGQILKRQNTSGSVLHDNWWSPTQPAVGSGHWVRMTLLTGTFSSGSDAAGVWLDLSTSRLWQKTLSSTGTAGLTATAEVAMDPDGTHVVSTMAVTLDVEYAT
jgi:hypothetical protein